jgi:hypothetical protein
MWLRDLLPLTMTNSRIMTYGYDAGVYKNKGTLRILDNAENLLFSILNTRKTDQVNDPMQANQFAHTDPFTESQPGDCLRWP